VNLQDKWQLLLASNTYRPISISIKRRLENVTGIVNRSRPPLPDHRFTAAREKEKERERRRRRERERERERERIKKK